MRFYRALSYLFVSSRLEIAWGILKKYTPSFAKSSGIYRAKATMKNIWINVVPAILVACALSCVTVRAESDPDASRPRPIPARPPDPLPPCPPVPPEYSGTPPECKTFEELRDEYLKLEGHGNRRLMFYHVFSRFVAIDRGVPLHTIRLDAMIATLGDPDLKRSIADDDGVPVDDYIYLFDFKSAKDWACIATYKNGVLIRVAYAEFGERFKTGWKQFEGATR